MKAVPRIRVSFVLALLAVPVAAAEFGPLLVGLEIPDALRRRPIWCAAPLPGGHLAVGFEGGVAVGVPGGAWQTVSAPGGRTVRVIRPAHERVLAAGFGFCAIVRAGGLQLVEGMSGEYADAEAVPEGWLVAGSDGAWLVNPDGVARQVCPPPENLSGLQTLLLVSRGEVLVSVRGRPLQAWRGGRLEEHRPIRAPGGGRLYRTSGSLELWDTGVWDPAGRIPWLAPPREAAEKSGGYVGLADFDSVVLAATYHGGLAAHDRGTGRGLWQWRDGGNVFGLQRHGGDVLVSTALGVFNVADPVRVGQVPLRNVRVAELLVDAQGAAELVTSSGVLRLLRDRVEESSESWPVRGEMAVEGANLRFAGVQKGLRSRFLTGAVQLRDTAAVSLSHELVLISRNGRSVTVPLEGLVGAVATDGNRIFAGTAMKGVYVVEPEGRIVARHGTGRATVSELGPGRVALLFWDGEVIDSDGQRLGKVPEGNPLDAALVQGRVVVLATRAEGSPVLGWLSPTEWAPIEIPGLAAVGAEQIAASDEFLFVAGPSGILRMRLPLVASNAPTASWSWSAETQGREVRLPDPESDEVRLRVPGMDLPPAPATTFRLRTGRGEWITLAPGATHRLVVGAGATPVELTAERNGRVDRQEFVVIRPRPWYQRPWAWPIHVGALGLVVFGLARWRTRHLERRTRELEARVKERTEELQKANAVKEEFLASISHEIRNPLNGVVGICEMLARRDVGARERMLVRTLGGCADQLRSMLDDILDFSQLERKSPNLTNVDFDLVALVEECARVMDPDLRACSLLLPEQACWLHGDSGKLRQIVCNLISNALKYGVPREAGVEVKLKAEAGGRVRLRVAVRNTGPTIPAVELPRLFDSFQRGSQTAGVPGSGLGLAVCRRLANALGGHLTAASTEGVTEFALEALLPSSQPPASVDHTSAPVSRALAIEDEDYNRIVLGDVLRMLGYSVDWAVDAAAALRLAAERPYDLVLTDWRLPDMEGGELCRRLNALMPEPKPPVIAVTAYASREKLEEARAVGMAGFVTKPVTREKLETAIRGVGVGQVPRRSLDTDVAPAGRAGPLAQLGDLAPSPAECADRLAGKWRALLTLADLQDPRTAKEAHSLRSLLLMVGDEAAADQLALIETAADAGEWADVRRLLPIAAEDVGAIESRLRR
ncbi:MAG: response regulator [Verrucomicrobia bacterium]|nr:response regulator [Verrucomicrobiota bacterium]